MSLGGIPGKIGRKELRSGHDTRASAYGESRWLEGHAELMYLSLKLHEKAHRIQWESLSGWKHLVSQKLPRHPCKTGPERSARSPHELKYSSRALTAVDGT